MHGQQINLLDQLLYCGSDKLLHERGYRNCHGLGEAILLRVLLLALLSVLDLVHIPVLVLVLILVIVLVVILLLVLVIHVIFSIQNNIF